MKTPPLAFAARLFRQRPMGAVQRPLPSISAMLAMTGLLALPACSAAPAAPAAPAEPASKASAALAPRAAALWSAQASAPAGGASKPQAASPRPMIAKGPSDLTISSGMPVQFSATVEGQALSYQWEYLSAGTWLPIAGATNPVLAWPLVTEEANGMRLRLRVSHGSTQVLSREVRLTVYPTADEPSIVGHARAATVKPGQTATFSVMVTGRPAPTVKWQVSSDGGRNFVDIEGANTPRLTTAPVALQDSGLLFRAVVSNRHGAVESDIVALTVEP